jgi:nucleoside-diphosphate-sugar epimerase
MSGRHILVTGGFGFIGSTLVRQLISYDYKVTVLDSLTYSGKAEKLDAKIARYETDPEKGEGKKELLAKAQGYEKARDEASKHTPWLTFASMAFQLAIVLLSASILAVNNKMYKGSLYVAVAGMILLSQGIWLWF